MMDKIRLNANAHQKLATSNPGTSQSAKSIITALITNKNNPIEKTVIGIVRITNNGLRVALSNANTAAKIIAVRNVSTATPGNK